MNHRCYQCGWSFTLGREAVEAAVAQAGGDKFLALPCPRCRRINKIPMQQLRRTLPPGWTPGPPVEAPPAAPVSEAAVDEKPAEGKTSAKKTSSTRSTTTKRTPAKKTSPAS